MINKGNFISPYIIWTMRRTGGTSFMSFLSRMSPYKSTEHEPFNDDRIFGYITEKYKRGEDVEKDLIEVLKKENNIKHCYEIVPMELNLEIYKISKQLGYKHLFLYRENQISRVMSLEVSILTDVWGPKQAFKYDKFISGEKKLPKMNIDRMKNRLKTDIYKSDEIRSIINAEELSFEKLYFNSPSKQFENTERTLSYLGFEGPYNKVIVNEIIDCFYSGETPSNNIKKMIENYDMAKNELEKYSQGQYVTQ